MASRRRDFQLQGRDKTALSYHTAILQLTWYKYIDFVFISRVERWKTVKGGEKDNDGVILLIDLLSLCPEEKKTQFDVKLGYRVWRAAYFALFEIIKISSLNHKIQGCFYLVLNFANFNERDGIKLEHRKVYYIQPVNQNITEITLTTLTITMITFLPRKKWHKIHYHSKVWGRYDFLMLAFIDVTFIWSKNTVKRVTFVNYYYNLK